MPLVLDQPVCRRFIAQEPREEFAIQLVPSRNPGIPFAQRRSPLAQRYSNDNEKERADDDANAEIHDAILSTGPDLTNWLGSHAVSSSHPAGDASESGGLELLPVDGLQWVTADDWQAQAGAPQIRALASGLSEGSTRAIQALGSVLGWVQGSIRMTPCYVPLAAIDAVSVLESQSSNCAGFSNLPVTLLRCRHPGNPSHWGRRRLSGARCGPCMGHRAPP